MTIACNVYIINHKLRNPKMYINKLNAEKWIEQYHSASALRAGLLPTCIAPFIKFIIRYCITFSKLYLKIPCGRMLPSDLVFEEWRGLCMYLQLYDVVFCNFNTCSSTDMLIHIGCNSIKTFFSAIGTCIMHTDSVNTSHVHSLLNPSTSGDLANEWPGDLAMSDHYAGVQ